MTNHCRVILSLFAFSSIDNKVYFTIFQAVNNMWTAFSYFIYRFTF
ncbi:Uncharacterised protein [Klebsiella pneumoniae]|nr:Uncharacterised protein [Klebsiella pneumoniae]